MAEAANRGSEPSTPGLALAHLLSTIFSDSRLDVHTGQFYKSHRIVLVEQVVQMWLECAVDNAPKIGTN